MACFDENTVVAFFAASADGRESEIARRVEAHAAECVACRNLLAVFASASPAGSVLTAPPSLPAEPRIAGAGDSLARRLAHAQAAQRVGQTVAGKWKIERLVGVGGMAQVFEATHRNGKPVAIKMMRPELAVEPSLVQRFLREAYAANRVAHPGALAVHDDDKTADGVPFLVMDLLEGRTLRDRVCQAGPLDVTSALRVADQVLDVLAAAHEKGIVHRDIKPENLFETKDGVVRVLDFGIARLMEPGEGMTHSGVTMGTVGYMPPEQARGKADAVDARSDLWAVGATLFHLMTGRAVHDASTHNEMLLLAMTVPVAPIRAIAPEIPAAVGAVLDKALAFDKAARWDDARAMQHALRDAANTSDAAPAGGAGASAMRVRARPMLGAVLGAGAFAAVAVGAFFAMNAHRSAPPPSIAPSVVEETPVAPSEPLHPPAPGAAVAIAAPRESALAAPSAPAAPAKAMAPRPRAKAAAIPTATPVVAPVLAPAAPPSTSPAPPAGMNPLGPRT